MSSGKQDIQPSPIPFFLVFFKKIRFVLKNQISVLEVTQMPSTSRCARKFTDDSWRVERRGRPLWDLPPMSMAKIRRWRCGSLQMMERPQNMDDMFERKFVGYFQTSENFHVKIPTHSWRSPHILLPFKCFGKRIDASSCYMIVQWPWHSAFARQNVWTIIGQVQKVFRMDIYRLLDAHMHILYIYIYIFTNYQ